MIDVPGATPTFPIATDVWTPLNATLVAAWIAKAAQLASGIVVEYTVDNLLYK